MSTVDADMAAHSLLGASGAHRWMHCPGSFHLTRQAPSRAPSVYAIRGTLAHTYIEQAIVEYQAGRGDLTVSDDNAGCVHHRGAYEIEIDQDFVDGVNLMLAYIAQRLGDQTLMKTEFQVTLDDYFQDAFRPPVRLYGRVDLGLIDPAQALLEIVDYKNGIGILVEPRDNPQMLYYAAGVLAQVRREHPQLVISSVRLTVVQPHARTPEKIRSWAVDALDVLMWVDEELVPAVRACAEPDAPLVLGPWCRFCPAAFTCPKLAAEANKMAAHEFSDDGISMPADPAVLGKYLTTAEHAETWIKALREFATEQLKSQVRIPGWSLGPTRPVRRWIDDKQVGRLLTDKGFSLDKIMSVELRSPAQIEKLLKGKDELWRHTFAPLVESHSSGEKLVHTDIASDFPEEG